VHTFRSLNAKGTQIKILIFTAEAKQNFKTRFLFIFYLLSDNVHYLYVTGSVFVCCLNEKYKVFHYYHPRRVNYTNASIAFKIQLDVVGNI
jgi:hypothetical protein